MVCKEDVVTWFKELSSHKRVDVMCTLLNMCLPFELRFLGTCLEDLGKRDFHDLRDAENKANNVSELSDLQCISDKRTQRKLALYLSLLHSCNHACSNGLYKILANFDFGEISNLTNNSSEDNPLDELLLLYTIALNHPAFTYEQRTVFGSILLRLQDEENKMYAAKHPVVGLVYVKNPMQSCVPCPSSEEHGQLTPCTGMAIPPSHAAGEINGRNSVPAGVGMPPGLNLPAEHQMTATGYVHVTFPSATHQPLAGVPWHGSVAPLMMTSLCGALPGDAPAGGEVSPFPTSPLMSRQSSPSQSGSPSRAGSPTRPSAPPPPSAQQPTAGGERAQGFKGPPAAVRRTERSAPAGGPVRQNCVVDLSMPPPARPALPRKGSVETAEALWEALGKEMPNYQSLQNYSAEELRRMCDDELKDLGLPLGAIHQLRSIVAKLSATNGITALDKRDAGSRQKESAVAPEGEVPASGSAERKGGTVAQPAPQQQRYSNATRLEGPPVGTPVVYPPALLSAAPSQCFTCFAVPVSAAAPGRYVAQPPQQFCCVNHGMRGLRIGAGGDAGSRHGSNSSSGASDSSSTSHSPPDTPSMPTTPQWDRGYGGKDPVPGERWSPGCEELGDKDRRLQQDSSEKASGGSCGADEGGGAGPPHQPPPAGAAPSNNNNSSNSSSSSSSGSGGGGGRARPPGALGRSKSNPPGLQTVPPRGRGPGPTPSTVVLESGHKSLPSCRRGGPAANGSSAVAAAALPRTPHPPPTPPHDERKMLFVPSDMVAHAYSAVNSSSQPPAAQYSAGGGGSGSGGSAAQQPGGSSNVPYSPATAAAAYLPQAHFPLRTTGSIFPNFPHSSYMRPFPFSPNGELVYQYHGPQTPPPHPPPFIHHTPMVAAFSPVIPPPKLCCYNCGSQSHLAADCKEPTMEEMTKPGQYRIDYVPYHKPGECSTEK